MTEKIWNARQFVDALRGSNREGAYYYTRCPNW